jgi:hypothetical protein
MNEITERLRDALHAAADIEPIESTTMEIDWSLRFTPKVRLHRGRPILTGALVAMVIAGVTLAIAFGPGTSSNLRPASTATGETSVVGDYVVHFITTKASPFGPPHLTLRSNGTFNLPAYTVPEGAKDTGSWKDSNGIITMSFVFPPSAYPGSTILLSIRPIGMNLGSRSKPGYLLSNGKRIGQWYAVRIAGSR